VCLEGCLPLVACCDTNIVVASAEVKLGVDLHTARPEGPNPLFTQSISILLHANTFMIAPQCLYTYLFLIPTQRPIVCAPVSCLHLRPLHPHVDSRPSYRCLLDHILIAYLYLRPSSSILYK